jgi:hypothetical protein
VDGTRPWVRDLADASSWMDLVHLLRTIGIPGLLAAPPLPGLVKGAVVAAVTGYLTLWTYDWCVRATAVGALRNRRRDPSGLPRSGPPSSPPRVPV